MASTKYAYSIQSDFPEHKVCSDCLTTEIGKSAIITALDYIHTASDDCNIWFKGALSEGDETILDGVVAAHDGESLVMVDSVTLASPSTADGTPVFLPCLFPSGVYLYVTSAGDGESTRGAGDLLVFKSDTEEDVVKYVQFLDACYEADAIIQFIGGDTDGTDADYVEVEVVAPATVVEPNVGNTGNCNVVNHVIVPAAGNGAYDVDLEEAVPVPAKDSEGNPNGYWNLSVIMIGKGTITPNVGGVGSYHLLDVETKLIRHGNKCILLGSNNIEVSMPVVEPKVLLPQWKGKITVHNYGHTGLKVAVTLKLARVLTV